MYVYVYVYNILIHSDDYARAVLAEALRRLFEFAPPRAAASVAAARAAADTGAAASESARGAGTRSRRGRSSSSSKYGGREADRGSEAGRAREAVSGEFDAKAPDVVLIDGGKGQLSAALSAVRALHVCVCVCDCVCVCVCIYVYT